MGAPFLGRKGPLARRRPKKGDPDAEALGRSRGGFYALIHVVCDALGNPLEIALTPGQAGDCPQAEPLLERVVAVEPVAQASEEETSDSETLDAETPDAETPDARQRLSLGAVLADKGYDSDDLLEYVASLKAEAVIPAKKNRTVQRPLNRELYKDRNKVERFFGRVKHYRRIATRYEKTARNYMAMLHLVSTMVWLL
ncbi:IS5 family transposase [Salinibacter ruber]|uniref:IS5 family transposase n=1 Tax=Salinibacter ruber TaxID=146919 RepID=UPI002343117C|nr:IS5 family transposase [Salinibacter ruber]